MGKLLLLFIVVPAVELGLLIQVGNLLGMWPTLALIVFTGIVGAYLARLQGLSVLTRAQEQMNRGDLPVTFAFLFLFMAAKGDGKLSLGKKFGLGGK